MQLIFLEKMETFENNLSLIDPDINHFETHINFQSHTIDSFNDNQNIEPNSLKLYHNNARSLSPDKVDQYEGLFHELNIQFDVLIFTETWLTPEDSDLRYFNGFQIPIHLFRSSEDKTKGGGISIYVKNNQQFRYREDLSLSLPYIECLFIEIKFNNTKYLIGGIYRPPDTNTDLFIDKFNSLLEPLKSSHKLILLGDYNIDFQKNNNQKYNFEICLQSNYLVPTIFSATRVATKTHNNELITTETLIDNIFINHNMNYQSGIIETSISDHFSIYITIPEISACPKTESNSVQYRLMNDVRKRKFNNDLIKSDIMQVFNNNIAKLAFEQFINIFQNLYDNAFPIKTKIMTPLDMQKPWVNNTLIRRIKIRDNLNNLARRKKIDRKVYTVFRNKVTSELRLAKTKYFEEQFEKHADNIKKNLGSN